MDAVKLLEFVRVGQLYFQQCERAAPDERPHIVSKAIDDMGPRFVDLVGERLADERASFRRRLVLDCLHAVGEFDDGDFGELLERRVRAATKLVAKLDAEDRPAGSAVGRQVLEPALADPRLELLDEATRMWRSADTEETRREIADQFFASVTEEIP